MKSTNDKSQPKRDWLSIIDKPTFLLPAILILIAVIVGIAAPKAFEKGANVALSFLTVDFGWLYAISTFVLLIFCLWAGFSKYGNIKLGGKDAKPEMSFWAWFSIALTSGIAIGIVFWSVAEPLANFTNPPAFTGIESGTPEAAEHALPYVFMHWGLHPYAIYTAVGVCCAFIIMNGKQKFQVSSALYPLLGEKANGTLGKIINGICIFALVGGIGTSLGMAVQQFVTGIGYVFGVEVDANILAIFVIGGMAIFYIVAACSGLHKGIKYISQANMYIYIALLVWAFIFGGTLFIINCTTSAVGQYLAILVPQSFYLEPAFQSGWVSGTTIFYWAWWLAFAPLVGLFLIMLSKGRTIRQFVLVNMIVPTIFAIAWFGVFGSSSMLVEMTQGGLADTIAEYGVAAALFAYVKTLPLSPVLIVLAFLAIIFSFATLAESMTLSLAEMTTTEEEMARRNKEGRSAPTFLKIIWGSLMGLIAFALFYSGGLSAMQTSCVVCAFPILIIMGMMVASYIKSMKHRSEYDMTLTDEEREALRLEESKNANGSLMDKVEASQEAPQETA